ncbi:hypothetical protein EYF80_000043 [Liparis tanakae]|uniref:Uncharacterized protein n=1 Tax=Liparis tanakae TaxID=230148 RepID=A0A4Z2JH00_9TELE|nr:hypothetical protein EYF80_000043 [Liparis tanakae]
MERYPGEWNVDRRGLEGDSGKTVERRAQREREREREKRGQRRGEASLSPGEWAPRWATCERSPVSGAGEVDTESPPSVRRLFVNSGPVLEESVHTAAVEQFKAGSPSGQGDGAVMKIPQERSEGNSTPLFVMGKKEEKTGTGGRDGAMSENGKEAEETIQCASEKSSPYVDEGVRSMPGLEGVIMCRSPS